MSAEEAGTVISSIVTVVGDLEQEDEQSSENFGIIANIYENINELVENGEINISDTVSWAI